MHRHGAPALDLMNPVAAAKMPSQPLDAHLIGDVARCDENIAPAAHEIGSVEHRFELGDDVAHLFASFGHAIMPIIELTGELWLGGRGPARSFSEIFLQKRAIRKCFILPARPRHRRLDDLVAEYEHAVARTGVAKSPRRNMGRGKFPGVIVGIWPANFNAERLQKVYETIKLFLSGLYHKPRILKSRDERLRFGGDPRYCEGHHRMGGRYC